MSAEPTEARTTVGTSPDAPAPDAAAKAPDATAKGPDAPPPDAPAEAKPADAGRGWAEWLWQGQALAAARAAASPALREARGLVERGDRLLEPVPALRHGSGAATALELYERALTLTGEAPAPSDDGSDVEARARTTRERALGRIDELDPLPAEELRLYARRWIRVGAMLGVVGLLSAGAGLALRTAARGPNLAAGRPWTSSSKYGGFSPEAHLVDTNKSAIFFHTNEEQDPWVQFDLGAPTSIARVVAKNRSDCCTERAIPLVVQVSTDGARWEEVAHRNDPFSTWDAVFPARSARFVRLTTKKRTWLHLEQVTVHGK